MATRDISICDNEGSPGNKEITICHERTNPEGREITVCGPDCSGTLPALELTGADELTSTTDYEQYTASGGVPPYSFSFDGGTIDDTGKVISITPCGGTQNGGAIGTISVTDACGQIESIEVRMPGGSWQNQIDYITIPVGDCCNSYNRNTLSKTGYIGRYKYIESRYGFCSDGSNTCHGVVGGLWDSDEIIYDINREEWLCS